MIIITNHSSGVALATKNKTRNLSTLPKGHTVTYHHRFEQQSCNTAQDRPTHEAHLQQGLMNPEYKSTQQYLIGIKTDKTQECKLRDSRYGFSNKQGSFA